MAAKKGNVVAKKSESKKALPGGKSALVIKAWGGIFLDPDGRNEDGDFLYIAVPRAALVPRMTYKDALGLLKRGVALGFHGDDSDGGRMLTAATVFTWNVGPPPPPLLD